MFELRSKVFQISKSIKEILQLLHMLTVGCTFQSSIIYHIYKTYNRHYFDYTKKYKVKYFNSLNE